MMKFRALSSSSRKQPNPSASCRDLFTKRQPASRSSFCRWYIRYISVCEMQAIYPSYPFTNCVCCMHNQNWFPRGSPNLRAAQSLFTSARCYTWIGRCLARLRLMFTRISDARCGGKTAWQNYVRQLRLLLEKDNRIEKAVCMMLQSDEPFLHLHKILTYARNVFR